MKRPCLDLRFRPVPVQVVRPVGDVEDEEGRGVDDLHAPLDGVGDPLFPVWLHEIGWIELGSLTLIQT